MERQAIPNPKQQKVVNLISYLILSDERKARSLLYNAGYPHPNSPQEMQKYFFDWLRTDKTSALRVIMKNHPDSDMIKSVNDMSDYQKPATDPSFPLPNTFAVPSNTYYDKLNYNDAGLYPYNSANLANRAVPLSPSQMYTNAIVTGMSNYGGHINTSSLPPHYAVPFYSMYGGTPDPRKLAMIIIGLIVLYSFLKVKS